MKSWDVTAFGTPLTYRELPTPAPVGREVLVRVETCGLCHTDLHNWHGVRESGGRRVSTVERRGPLPHRLGHEIAGTVVALGPEASGAEIGDRRVVFPWIGCGACRYCRLGDEAICEAPRFLGTMRDGGFADHVLVPDARYLMDFGELPVAWACTFACGGVTARAALRRLPRLDRTDPLLLIGAGGVGLFALKLAQALYECPVIVADPDPMKRQAALSAGAAQAVGAGTDAVAALLEQGGVAAVLDFVGTSDSAALGLGALRKGGSLVFVGLFGGSFAMSTTEMIRRRLTISGSPVGSLADLEEVLLLARSGALRPAPYATRPMAEVSAALADLEAGRIVGRVVLTP